MRSSKKFATLLSSWVLYFTVVDKWYSFKKALTSAIVAFKMTNKCNSLIVVHTTPYMCMKMFTGDPGDPIVVNIEEYG